MAKVEYGASPFFQKVGIEAVGAQHGYAALEFYAVLARRRDFVLKRFHLLLEAHPGNQSMIALDRVIGEIERESETQGRHRGDPRPFSEITPLGHGDQ
jgi:hypothetical protein